MIKRRSFLTYFSIGWLASCFPMVLAICTPTKSSASGIIGIDKRVINNAQPLAIGEKDATKPASQRISKGFTVIGSVSDLDKNGYLQTKEVAVIRNPYNPQKLIAVNPKCTDQGCDVKWMAGEKRYTCPCHSSNFEAKGEVINGSATKPLAAYPAKIVGDRVLVEVLPPPPVNPSQNTPPGRGRRN